MNIQPTTLQTTTLLILLLLNTVSYAELYGTKGSAEGKHWQSSWLNLSPPINFKENETLHITVKGNAKKVLIRLLPASATANSPRGIEGDPQTVPADRIVKIQLSRDHFNIKQISVHAGKEAWGTQFGEDNGHIKIVSIKRHPL